MEIAVGRGSLEEHLASFRGNQFRRCCTEHALNRSYKIVSTSGSGLPNLSVAAAVKRFENISF